MEQQWALARAADLKPGDVIRHPVTGQPVTIVTVEHARGPRSWPRRLQWLLQLRQGPRGTDIPARYRVQRETVSS